ncbi:sensor domain-containing protein [Kitasatospora sp. NPDC085879]|uniref:sensor domain-containing protein n=1 Tax=Kitasatospora sp. NPDC085879 TaxID=3154769 RepID=UPI000BB16564|nr:sensor domain-containing protein [Streptomyces sp. TLI_235]PBC78390.1 putative sensor protein [Streptomyces sp. TLI_235]
MTTAPLNPTTAPYRSDVPAARRPGFLRAPFAAATYREIGFVLTGLPVAIAAFTVAVTLFSAGLGLLVTALGLPVLALLLVLARGFGSLERHRARVLLGTPVAAPEPVRPKRPGFWGTVTARLADGAGWRAVLHQVLMFPWAVLSFALTVTFLVTGWVVALYPLYHWVFARYTDWPGYRVFEFTTDAGRHHEYYITSPAQIAGVSAVGIALVLLTPLLVRGLTGVNRLAVRGLLGAR